MSIKGYLTSYASLFGEDSSVAANINRPLTILSMAIHTPSCFGEATRELIFSGS